MALLLISYVRDRKRATTKGNFLKRKAGNLFQDFLPGGAAGGRLVFSFESSGQGGPMTVCFDSFTYNNYSEKLISTSPFSTLNSMLLELSMTLSFKLLFPFSVLTTMR